jgi:small subunit ribosomal protein S16
MSVKIRLKRMGRTHRPFYRVNAINSRNPRDGAVIEDLGFYDPIAKEEGRKFVVNLDRCRYWLDQGAIPSETVSSFLKKAGIEHRMLRLPKPGKPKKTEEEAKGGATEGAAATPAEAPAAG